MRILLGHNSLYYPSYGGGDKSNRLLMQALAARGHAVRVVARVESFGVLAHESLLAELAGRGVADVEALGEAVRFGLNGVDVRVLTGSPQWRSYFERQIEEFAPEVILTSTDDPALVLFSAAVRYQPARVVYLVRATIATPFGPESTLPNAARTAVLKSADGAVGVSEYVARYAREQGGLDAIHVPISLLEPGEVPLLGSFDNRYVTMVNPCALKGIAIFLALAERFPTVEFAAIPSWGTTAADREALGSMQNVHVLPPVDNIDDVLRQTRVVLVPSLWAEARSRMILEGISRGIPVMASAVGGLEEAMMGLDYLLPVTPVTEYRPAVDELMVPVGTIPAQPLEPWAQALERLITKRSHYEELSARCRRVGGEYARRLSVEPFEAYLAELVKKPKRATAAPAVDRQKLLRLRLRKR